jgi:hypothetical protein
VISAAARDRAIFAACLLVGVAGWAWAGGREAWDSPWYGTVVLPLTYLALFGFGFLGSRGAWRWPALAFGAQLATLLLLRALRGEGPGSLAPLGAVLFGVLATIGLAPAYLGVALRRWRQKRVAARFAAEARRAAFTKP